MRSFLIFYSLFWIPSFYFTLLPLRLFQLYFSLSLSLCECVLLSTSFSLSAAHDIIIHILFIIFLVIIICFHWLMSCRNYIRYYHVDLAIHSEQLKILRILDLLVWNLRERCTCARLRIMCACEYICVRVHVCVFVRTSTYMHCMYVLVKIYIWVIKYFICVYGRSYS